ncbi:muscular LMNA-interacting protein isoform X11 [Macaca thibetana thibetana]|uniref:muscular LMNA-interacting protein isoform X11 n=1 Tax=Macaca thibetana thibetana TaxID=257877 RepID=UPI001E259600|nr:muscular LMNA-interacting protein isoform X12 [Macaca fascicularis]XP_050644969.1 muscular LMNA-interacting protein isoform X11 [Macaca thibetana thibetana]
MELEKHEKRSLLNKNLEEKLTVSAGGSEAKPLIFTFVPTVRRLPTHTQLTDTSKFLVKIPEESSDKSPETVNRSKSNDYLTLNAGSQQERDKATLTCPSEVSGTILQEREFEANKLQGMQQSDLFKAEYVLIVDSEGEDEATSRKVEQGPPGGIGTAAVRPKSLAISSSLVSDVVRPKTQGTDLKASSHPEMLHGIAPQQKHGQQYKTKSSYKAFAAIPTNTLLLEQKALDEPAKTESVSKDNTLEPPVELYFPAQLRQQTEELCATIDKVLQDSLSMHSSDSPSRSPKTLLGSDTVKTPTTLPRAAGRETKYANLSSPSSTVSESQLTKPGVIRPVPVKSRILLKQEEEVYEPNPFSKYLEDNSDLFSEQDVTVPPKPVSLHPLYQTKLYPPAKSLLHPQTLSQADCLAPGPFSHLSFSLSDEQDDSHTLLSHNACNKLSHPMAAIPEHEALDSKE